MSAFGDKADMPFQSVMSACDPRETSARRTARLQTASGDEVRYAEANCNAGAASHG
jgi:hypothetical protein